MSWIFGQKPREQETPDPDRELYNRAMEENAKLTEQKRKILADTDQRRKKLEEQSTRLRETETQLGEKAVLLGVLANDQERAKASKQMAALTSTVKEMLSLERRLRELEDKNARLRGKLERSKNSREKDPRVAVKDVEADYLLSCSMNERSRGKLSSKEEAVEKQKALGEMLQASLVNHKAATGFAEKSKASGWSYGEDVSIV